MRASTRPHRVVVASIAAAASILFAGCNDSNDVTSPGPVGAVADVSGTWSGQFDSNAGVCADRSTSVSIAQEGDRVRGSFRAPGCGIDGTLRGTLSGNHLTGSVGMLGCTDGAMTGWLESGTLTLMVGDFRKELISGDQEVLPGGQVRLLR